MKDPFWMSDDKEYLFHTLISLKYFGTDFQG